MVKSADRPAMTIAVELGHKATKTNKQTNITDHPLITEKLLTVALSPNVTYQLQLMIATYAPHFKFLPMNDHFTLDWHSIFLLQRSWMGTQIV